MTSGVCSSTHVGRTSSAGGTGRSSGRSLLVAEIEGKLQQRVSQANLFSIRWSLA